MYDILKELINIMKIKFDSIFEKSEITAHIYDRIARFFETKLFCVTVLAVLKCTL